MEEKVILQAAVEEAKKIMRKFVGEYFGQEDLGKINAIFNEVQVKIDDNPKIALQCGGYFDGETVFVMKETVQNNKNTMTLIEIIIHEYAHAFSGLISEGEINCIIEEALANLFAEMSINYYLQNGDIINNISEEEYKKLKEEGYHDIYSYKKEGEFLQNILKPLQISGYDKSAIKEYLFGNKEIFVALCEHVFSGFKTMLYAMQGVKIYMGENNTQQYFPWLEEMVENLLVDFFENYQGDISEDTNNSLYQTDTSLLRKIQIDREVFQGVDFENLSIEDINRISKNHKEKLEQTVSKEGYTPMLKKFISSWYDMTNGNLQEFDEILRITDKIPIDIIFRIMQDNNIEINATNLLKYFKKYNEVNGNATFKEDGEKLLTSLLEGCTSQEAEIYKEILEICNWVNVETGEPSITPTNIEYFSKIEISPEELKIIVEFFYKSEKNEELIRKFIKVIKDKGLFSLNPYDLEEDEQIDMLCFAEQIGQQLTNLEDICSLWQYEEGSLGKITLMHIDTCSIEHSVRYAMEEFEMYGCEILNSEEILEKIIHWDFSDLRFKFANYFPEWSIFNMAQEETKPIFRKVVRQFLEDMEQASEFTLGDEWFCKYILNKQNQIEMGISEEIQKRVVEALKSKMKIEIDDEKRKRIQSIIGKNSIISNAVEATGNIREAIINEQHNILYGIEQQHKMQIELNQH